MNNTVALGRMLREARIRQNLGMTELARKLGVSVQFICDVEGGRKSLPFVHLDGWANEIKTDPDVIMAEMVTQYLTWANRQRRGAKKLMYRIVPVTQETQ